MENKEKLELEASRILNKFNVTEVYSKDDIFNKFLNEYYK